MKTGLVKVAVVRDMTKEKDHPFALYLHCPCGAKPHTTMIRALSVHCKCGRKFDGLGFMEDYIAE